VGTAEDRAAGLDAVPDDPAVAVRTVGRQGVDRALERVEDRAASIQPNEMRATLAMIEDEHPVARPPCAEDGTPRPGAVV